MHKSKWLQWAGGLGMMGAIVLGSSSLRADDETPRREQPDKSAAEEQGKSRREARKSQREKPAGARGRADAGGNMPQPYWLGLECRPAPDLVREQLNLPEGQGLVVEITAPEGPAAKAGLKKHDILLTANEKPLGGVPQLIELLQVSDGKEISFKLLRGGKETTVSVAPVKGGHSPMYHARVIEQRVTEQMERVREQLERSGDPIRMRFFHPGVVLPPAGTPLPPLPDGMRVTITRQGGSPAEIEVQQGDETWKGTEEDMTKMPPKFVAPVAQMLARGPAGGINLEFRRGPEGRRAMEGGVNQRVNELTRQVEAIRQELQDLHSRLAGDRKDGPGNRERGPRDNEPADGERRDGASAPSSPRGESKDAPPPAKEPVPAAAKP